MVAFREGSRMTRFMPLITALIGLAGGLLGTFVGASVQHANSVQLERQRYLLDSRTTAYNNFFAGQAKLLEANEREANGAMDEANKLRSEYRLLVRDARFQIAIFGTRPVVNNLVDYFRATLPLKPCEGTREIWLKDIRTYQQMRREVFEGDARQSVDDSTLILLLFDCQLP